MATTMRRWAFKEKSATPAKVSGAPKQTEVETPEVATDTEQEVVFRSPTDPRTYKQSNLIAYQRTYGNQAVQRLLAPKLTPRPKAQPTVIQRHSSYEHFLLGQVEPTKLSAIPDVRQILETHRKSGTKLSEQEENKRKDVAHSIRQEMRRLLLWQKTPPSPTPGEPVKKTDEQWEVPLVTIPVRDGTVVATYSEINTLPDMFGSVNDLKKTPKTSVQNILQGVRSQSFVELGKLLSEVEGQDWNKSFENIAEERFEGSVGEVGFAKGMVQEAAEVAGKLDVIQNKELNDATSRKGEETSSYFAALSRNACHFAPESWGFWRKYHEEARKLAAASRKARAEAKLAENQGKSEDAKKKNEEADRLANEALLQNAFGEHYLQDSFAAGHLVNKTQVMQWFVEWLESNIHSTGVEQALGGEKRKAIHGLSEGKWAMVKYAAMQKNLKSNGQEYQDQFNSKEKAKKEGKRETGMTLQEGNDLLGMQAGPEIKLMMWWRHQAHDNKKLTGLTVSKVAQLRGLEIGQAHVMLEKLVKYGFVTHAQVEIKPAETNWLGMETKPAVTAPGYLLDESQMNVLDSAWSVKTIEDNAAAPYRTAVKGKDDYDQQALEFNLQAYRHFLNNTLVQGSTKALHDHFCKNGLEVVSLGGDRIGSKIYGDNNMLKAGAGPGVEYSAKTSQYSREAVFEIISGDPDKAKSIDEIYNRMPGSVVMPPDQENKLPEQTLPLADWMTQLKGYAFSTLFPGVSTGGALFVDKTLNGLADMATIKVPHEPF